MASTNSQDLQDPPAPAPVRSFGDERLQRLLEALSLTGSEARTMLALFRFGSVTLNQLSQATGIGRSNLYPVLDSLQARGVARRLSGRYAVWQSPGPAEALAALKEAENARLAAARESFDQRLEEAMAGLAQLPSTAEATEEVIVLGDDAQSTVIYDEAMAGVEGEILVFNRGPYAGDVVPSTSVLDAVARGVRARAIYQSTELDDPAVRRCADVYADAGVDQRVVAALPVAMAALGGELVLLTLPSNNDTADFHTAIVRNRAMVQLVSAAFNYLWDQGRPYEPHHTRNRKASA